MRIAAVEGYVRTVHHRLNRVYCAVKVTEKRSDVGDGVGANRGGVVFDVGWMAETQSSVANEPR